MTIHRLLPDDDLVKLTIDIGSGCKLLVRDDGHPTDGRRFFFEHRCRDVPDAEEPDGLVQIICAPSLQEGHVATWEGELVTINPSILCPDCGTHGFVRANSWQPSLPSCREAPAPQ